MSAEQPRTVACLGGIVVDTDSGEKVVDVRSREA